MIVCSECKGTMIETKMWVDPNTMKVGECVSDNEPEDNYCSNCRTDVKFEEIIEEVNIDKISIDYGNWIIKLGIVKSERNSHLYWLNQQDGSNPEKSDEELFEIFKLTK